MSLHYEGVSQADSTSISQCVYRRWMMGSVNQEVGHAECRLDRPIDTYSSIDIYIQHLQKNKKKQNHSLSSKLFIIVIVV